MRDAVPTGYPRGGWYGDWRYAVDEAPDMARAPLAVISRLDFVFAKSMPDVPHEYTLRERAADTADYDALYHAIMRDGVIHYWRGRGARARKPIPARYLYPGDGWMYWSMSAKRSDLEGRHPLWVSHHINRNTVEETERLRGRGLVLTPADYEKRLKRPPGKRSLPFFC